MRWPAITLLCLAACGCATRPAPAPAPAATDASAIAPAATTNAPTAATAKRAGPYSAEELARLAAERAPEAMGLLLKAAARRRKAADDVAWKNPQLRLGRTWSSSDDSTPARYSDTWTRKWSRDYDYDNSVELRFYISNPFVNRWLRRQGSAEAGAIEAHARQEAYEVACEVRTLCQELAVAEAEQALVEKLAGLRAKLQAFRESQSEAGVGRSPLDSIQAETKKEQARVELAAGRAGCRSLRREIAALAGVSLDYVGVSAWAGGGGGAEREYTLAELEELALQRRPDLAQARLERDAAEYSLAAAKAARIPWFDFVDGRYQNGDYVSKDFSSLGQGYDRSTGDKEDWRLRFGITLPIFSWMGGGIKMSRLELAAAEACVSGLDESIRGEISGAFEEYRAAAAEHRRTEAAAAEFISRMEARIDAMERDGGAAEDEMLKAREELVNYRRVCLKNAEAWLMQRVYLETATGGPLPQK